MTGSPLRRGVWHSALRLLGACGLIMTGAIMLALVGLGELSSSFYMIAIFAKGYTYIRRSPWDFLFFSLWVWTLTPFTRRVIDFYHGFDPTSIILGTPNLLSLLMLIDILSSTLILRLKESAVGALLLTPIMYGLTVSFSQGQVVPGLVGAADWIAPLLYYYFLLTHASRVTDLDGPFKAFITLNMLVVGGYGLLQYMYPPSWDAAWVINAGLATSASATAGGHPVAYQIRVFTTLNSPGVAAPWLVMLLLLSLYFRTAATSILAAVCVIVLLTTLVRAALGALLVSLMITFLSGGSRMLRSLAITAVVVVLGGSALVAVYPEIEDRLTSRFDTVNDLGDDDSAITRLAIYRAAPGLVDSHPFGLGLGALGRGAVSSESTDLVSIDSGPLAIYLSLGWIAGSIYLAGLAAILIQAVLAARSSGSSAALVGATAAIAGSLGLLFGNIQGLLGVVIWLCAGYASAFGVTTGTSLKEGANA